MLTVYGKSLEGELLRLLKHQTIRGKTFAIPAPLYICLAPQIYIKYFNAR